MFFLTGVARYLFVPLAEAVVFALLASYFFSRTIIPTLVMYLLGHEREIRERREPEGRRGIFTRLHAGFEHGFEAIRNAYASLLQVCLDHSAVFAVGFLVFCVASIELYAHLGRTSFRRWTRASSGSTCGRRRVLE